MSLSARAEKLLMSSQPIFDRWSIGTVIGEGSSGTVYEIYDGDGCRGALKVIPISGDEADGGSVSILGSNKERTEKYIDEMTGDIMSEVKIMHSLNGKRGIVGCLEYGMLETRDDGAVMRLVLIRMERLRSLNQAMRSDDVSFTQSDVVKMGIDLCTALIECRRQNIIHRDIKPANIFITPDGEYQLGDFGTAKLQERTMMASRRGTLAYIAPEIAAGQSYNATVDMYSLGIMMYQLLNDRRLPFLEENFKFSDMETAIERRLSGQHFPPPANADDELGRIIGKMCAFSPKERYSSAEQCKAALEEYARSQGKGKHKSKSAVKSRLLMIFAAAAITAVVLSAPMIYSVIRKNIMPAGEPVPIVEAEPKGCISSGNVNSSGMAACDGEWLYTSQDKRGERGYRVSLKDGTKEILCDYTMHDINLTDKYVVFSSQYTLDYDTSTKGSYNFIRGLFRMEKDGGNLTCLDDGRVLNPVVYDGYVYYFAVCDESHILFRLPIEGGTREKLGVYDKGTYNFYPQGSKLYIYEQKNHQLIRTNLDGSGRKVILEESISSFCIENGKLYFTLASFFNADEIYICDIEKLADKGFNINDRDTVIMMKAPQRIFELNVSENVIYFTTYIYSSGQNNSNESGIYRMSDDNINFEKLYEGDALRIQISGGRIYFYDDDTVFGMNPDGSDLQKLSDISCFYNMI
ncbi:MAG: DUF5050 domain-containing protein [Acutalibacteraceae bacterium]